MREAHPGERYAQPATVGEKREHARALHERDGVSWVVAVDDVDGTLHRSLDTKPNAAYLVDREGRIAYRSIWASDERGLRNALAAIVRGDAPPKGESRAMMLPMLRALGRIDDVIRSAGRQAQRDMWRANAPMALAGRLSTLFRPLAPDARAYATAAALLAAGAAAALALLQLVA